MNNGIPKAIGEYVQAYVARRRIRALLLSVGWAVVIGLAWGLLACAMDRWMGLSAMLRMVLLVIGVIGVVGAMVPGVVGAMRTVDWVDVAEEIERGNGEFG